MLLSQHPYMHICYDWGQNTHYSDIYKMEAESIDFLMLA